MKKLKFYPSIWQIYPFTAALYQMDREGRPIKDLILKNAYADELGVSVMNLKIIKISALQQQGQEHAIAGFPVQAGLLIKGMSDGEFLRSRSVLTLEPGAYTALRFYLGKSGNSFVYSDRSEESADGLGYLDFEFADGLRIEGDESPEAILRFDFAPFKQRSFFTAIRQLFKRPHIFSEIYN